MLSLGASAEFLPVTKVTLNFFPDAPIPTRLGCSIKLQNLVAESRRIEKKTLGAQIRQVRCLFDNALGHQP
jgi:hypothetical protein